MFQAQILFICQKILNEDLLQQENLNDQKELQCVIKNLETDVEMNKSIQRSAN